MNDTASQSTNWQRLLQFLERCNERGSVSLPPDDVRTMDADHVHRDTAEGVQEALGGFVEELSQKRGAAMTLHWGLGSEPPQTRAEAAAALGVPDHRIKQLEFKALVRLAERVRHPEDRSDGPASFYTGSDPYGRCSADPVRVDGVRGQLSLLGSLVHEQSGEVLIFHRRQSFSCPGREPMDVYEVVTASGVHWDELVLDAYGPPGVRPSRPPPGYVFRSELAPERRPERNRGDNRKHQDFPRAFLTVDEPPERYRRRHAPKLWLW
jgi:hypothetical protein